MDRYAVPHRINRKPGEPNSEKEKKKRKKSTGSREQGQSAVAGSQEPGRVLLALGQHPATAPSVALALCSPPCQIQGLGTYFQSAKC